MRKNTAGQYVGFQVYSTTDGTPVTSGSPTIYVTKDGGTQASGGGTVTHEGNGQWTYQPTQAETNGNHVVYSFSLSGAMAGPVNVFPVGYDETDAALGLNNVSAADVNAQCDTAIADASLATAASIAALNDLSATEVQDELTSLNLDKIFITTGAAGSVLTGTTLIMSGGTNINSDDLVGNLVKTSPSSGNNGRGQTRRIATASVSGDTITGTVTQAWTGTVLLSTPMQILPSVDEALTSSDVQSAAESAIEAKHLDHYVILQGSGAGSGVTGFSINSVSGIATDDLIGNLVLHINSGQVRRITDADISGSTLTGTVSPSWNNTPGLGASFLVLPGVNDWATAARGEPAQGAPPVSAALAEKIDWLYAYFRNEKRQDATELKLYADDGTTVIAKSPVSDDGTVTTIGEMVTGP